MSVNWIFGVPTMTPLDPALARPLPTRTHPRPHPPTQLEEDFIKANPAWVKELELMLASRVKAEIQALSSFGFQYLTQVRSWQHSCGDTEA